MGHVDTVGSAHGLFLPLAALLPRSGLGRESEIRPVGELGGDGLPYTKANPRGNWGGNPIP